jgi:hypothetical protein
MYQPYPTGGQVPEPPQRPEPPVTVLTAAKLMYAGAGVSAISLIATILTIGSLKTAIHNKSPNLTQAQLHTAQNAAIGLAIVLGLLGIGLWIWMARANLAGKNWARITSTVFFGLDTLGVLASLGQGEPLLSRLISIVVWLIGLGAILMLWRKESSQYFAAPQPL